MGIQSISTIKRRYVPRVPAKSEYHGDLRNYQKCLCVYSYVLYSIFHKTGKTEFQSYLTKEHASLGQKTSLEGTENYGERHGYATSRVTLVGRICMASITIMMWLKDPDLGGISHPGE